MEDIQYNSLEVVLIGASGLGREILSWNSISKEVSNKLNIVGFLDDNPNALNNNENYNTNDSYDDMSMGECSLSSNTSLNERDKEQIFVHLETCLSKLQKIMGYNVFALTTGYQGLISCCHFVVDDVLSTVYPWLHSTESNNKMDKREKYFLMM